MAGNQIRQMILKETPKGELTENHFAMREAPMPEIGEGQALVKTLLMSIDAANRAWMAGPTYREQVMPGDVMHTYMIGQVVESNSPDYKPGEIVTAEAGWADYCAVDAAKLGKTIDHRPLSNLHSVLGIAGLTAYFGLLDIGQPKEGDTVLVSGAAGSVGTFVGQIAKIKGARVVGVAGGPDKCAMIKDLGFDAAVDYKAGNLEADLQRACPDGIDVYFDNVAGPILQHALLMMNPFGRIACCGGISQYEATAPEPGPIGVPLLLVVKRIKMQGFIVLDYEKDFPRAIGELKGWLDAGKLQVVEDIVEGLENSPKALIGLLHGDNKGKRMVRVAPDPA